MVKKKRRMGKEKRMKYLVQCICMAVSILLLAGCGLSDKRPDYVGEVSRYAGVKESSVLRTHIDDPIVSVDVENMTFYVTNLSDEECSYSSDMWHLEVLYEDTWHEVPIKFPDYFPDDAVLCDPNMAYFIKPGKTVTESASLEVYDYRFQSGTYRLVQHTCDRESFMSLEFQMEE